MKNKPKKSVSASHLFGYRKQVLLVSLIVTTLVVTPELTMDPISVPKFSFMVILGSLLLPSFGYIKHKVSNSQSKNLVVILAIFLFSQILAMIFSGASFSSQLYGAPGRLTGFITYLTLAIYFIFCIEFENRFLTEKIINILIALGIILSTYGLLQSLGIEFFNYGVAYGSSVFGTLGNSNFLSAFLGISATATLVKFFDKSVSNLRRYMLFGFTLVSLLTIYRTNSQQGFLIFAAGLAFGINIYFLINGRLSAFYSSIVFSLLSGIITIAGVFNTGPLASAIYGSTLSLRQSYWRAAISILNDHPYFGIGIDNFFNWYRRGRTQETTLKNPGIVSDSAHNVFLDIGSGAGIFALVAYVLLVILVFRAIFRIASRAEVVDFNFIALATAWFAYQVQCLISINQLALALWGWVLGGVLIGYEIRTSNELRKLSDTGIRKASSKAGRGKFGIEALIYVVVASVMAGLPFVSSVKFLSSLKSGDPVAIQSSAYLFPYDHLRFIYVITALRDNKFDAQALSVTNDAVREFPDTFEIWALYASLKNASSAEIGNAKVEMKRLDPYNPDLK